MFLRRVEISLKSRYRTYKRRRSLIIKLKYGIRRRILLMLEQTHSNLGDVAIGVTQEQFCSDNFPECDLIFVPEEDYRHVKRYISRYINGDDVLVLIGGGSLGNEYIGHERNRRDIISSYPENLIISFPQTMHFTDEAELDVTRKIYSEHKNLCLAAREEQSYDLMKRTFISNKVILTPDIVFYLSGLDRDEGKRSGTLLVFRNDVERVLGEREHKTMFDFAAKFGSVRYTDTHGSGYIPHESRISELYRKLDEFRCASLVVTDRIHGMVFAAITGTPCVAMSNYNHKVRGTYEWIKNLSYIRYANNIDEAVKCAGELYALGECNFKYDNSFAVSEYMQITDIIKKGSI